MGVIIDRSIDLFQSMHDEAEVPYVCNERATLSLFAGGVWQSSAGALVLEEFTSYKQCERGSYKGRNDIWFSAGGVHCYEEAKQEWDTLNSRGPKHLTCGLESLVEECEAARRNSERSRMYGTVQYPLGILFLVLTVSNAQAPYAPQYLDEYHDTLRHALNELTSSQPYEIVWASYKRQELLESKRLYVGDPKWVASPALETFICMKVM
jgi:hypothetical protein